MFGRKLFSNSSRDDASRIKVGVGAYYGLDGLEVGDGGSICATDEGFAVSSETSLDHRDYLVPVVGEPSSSTCFIELTTLEGGEEPSSVLGLKVLDKVDERVNLPGGLWVLGVVAKANAKHAKDATGLAERLPIFFPNGHRAKRKGGLDRGEVFETLTIIFILEACVTEKGANSLSATTKVEISELTGHMILKFFKNLFIYTIRRQA